MEQPNAAPVVDTDLLCVNCDYNLRHQPVDGKCPECGATVRQTLEFPHLARSAPRWLVSLVDSVTVLLVAFGFAFVGLFSGPARDSTVSLGIGAAAWGTAWFAVWLLTRPEPGVSDFDAAGWAWTLRVLTTVSYCGIFLARPIAVYFESYGTLVVFLLFAFLAPATCLYFNHLRRAADRLPSRPLALQAGVLQLLLPVASLLSVVRLFTGRGPGSMTEFLLETPLVGLGSVGDAWTFITLLHNRLGVWGGGWLALAAAPSAVLVPFAAAVLVQFRIAFAGAVRAAGGRS